MRLKEKMISSFLVVAVMVVVLSIISLRLTRKVGENFNLVVRQSLPAMVSLMKWKDRITHLRLLGLESLLTKRRTGEGDSPFQKKLQRLKGEFLREKTLYSLTSKWSGRESFLEAIKGREEMLLHRTGELLKSRGKKNREVEEAGLLELRKLSRETSVLMEKAYRSERARMEQEYFSAFRSAHKAQVIQFGTMIGVVVLSILLGMFMATKISTPILALEKGAERVGRGELNTRVWVNSRDELASLAGSFNGMVRDLEKSTVSKNYLNKILETIENAVLVLDPKGGIHKINRGAVELLGYSQIELVGKAISSLFRGVGVSDETVGGGEIRGCREAVALTRNGEEVPILFSSSVMRTDGGEVEGIVCVAQNIKEKKKLEREILEISDREQLRIAQDLHDGLGQHLGGLRLWCDNLARGLEKEGSSLLERSKKIASLVKDATTYTRQLARSLYSVELQNKGLESALRELVGNFEWLYQKGCHLHIETALPVLPLSTSTHLYRIIQEALHNAIKHANPQEINISLRKGEKGIFLSVEDDGVGFSQPHHPGMGLQTMKYRAGILEGQLEIDSEKGKGTRINCFIPVGKNQEGP